ncbi:MAG TPA: hypothetical protein VMU95_17845 [Trebonia sp.]|nr:hypothetical protein [Trebonia sp.]
MAVRLRINTYEPVQADPLGRAFTGYFPRMTEQEAWEAGRGLWRMNADRVSREKFALIVGESKVRAVGQVTGIALHGDRIELQGHVLAEGHPVRDAYLGQPDPVENCSQNPVAYCDLPAEQQFVLTPCHCGCGQDASRDFLPGHDVRALQARVRQHFGGSALRFIQWVDAQLTRPGNRASGNRAGN